MFFRTFILPLPLHPNRMRAAAINAGSVSLRRVKQRVDDRSRFYARTMAACRRPKSFLRKMHGGQRGGQSFLLHADARTVSDAMRIYRVLDLQTFCLTLCLQEVLHITGWLLRDVELHGAGDKLLVLRRLEFV